MKGFSDIPSSPTACDCMHGWMYHPLSGDLSTTFQGGSAQLSQRSHILKTTQNKVQLQSRSWCSHRSALHPCHPKVAPAPLSPVISKELLSAKPESPAKHKHRSEDCLYQPAPLAKAKVAQSAVGLESRSWIHSAAAHTSLWHMATCSINLTRVAAA